MEPLSLKSPILHGDISLLGLFACWRGQRDVSSLELSFCSCLNTINRREKPPLDYVAVGAVFTINSSPTPCLLWASGWWIILLSLLGGFRRTGPRGPLRGTEDIFIACIYCPSRGGLETQAGLQNVKYKSAHRHPAVKQENPKGNPPHPPHQSSSSSSVKAKELGEKLTKCRDLANETSHL